MSDQGPPFPPPPPYGQQPPPPPYGPPPPQHKGFFGSLFDYSFTSFVGPGLIKVLYVLITILLGLFYLAIVIGGFGNSAGAGILALVLGGVGFLVYLAFARISLELCMGLFRITEDVHAMRQRAESR